MIELPCLIHSIMSGLLAALLPLVTESPSQLKKRVANLFPWCQPRNDGCQRATRDSSVKRSAVLQMSAVSTQCLASARGWMSPERAVRVSSCNAGLYRHLDATPSLVQCRRHWNFTANHGMQATPVLPLRALAPLAAATAVS